VSDRAIVSLAARQHGLVSVTQLRALGLDSRAIARRVERGWLRRRGGVFQVGPILGPCAREMAALLRCGERALLSHLTAAVVFALRAARPGAPVDVTLVGAGLRPRPGLRLRRVHSMPPGDVTTYDGLRITTPARTIADLSSTLPAVELGRLIEEARIRNLATLDDLRAREHGHPALRAALAIHDDPQITRSEAERRLLELIRAAGLPAPHCNARVLGFEVDMVWPDLRMVVEVDGYAFHGTREAFERDRGRDARLIAAGYRVLRVTWRQIVEEPMRVIATIAAVLQPLSA